MNGKERLFGIFVGALIFAVATPWTQAALVSQIMPVADAFVVQSNPTNNYGAAGALGISSSAATNGEFISVMRFDTFSTKSSFDMAFGAGQWSIQSVSLRLTATPPNNAIFNTPAAGQFSANWMESDSWVEGTGTPTAPTTTGITYNTFSSFLGANDSGLGTFSFGGGTSGSTNYSLGLPVNFTNDILAGNLVSLHLFAADPAVSYLFNSRNFGNTANRPELSITAVPEPGMASLLLLSLPFLSRRKAGSAR